MDFIGLGYGNEASITIKLHGIKQDASWVVILDEDAARAGAEDCYVAAETHDVKKAEREYENLGGTVSYSFCVIT